jgi:hypothetical protein
VTVVATGYGEQAGARREDGRSSLREPAGEPRVSRMDRSPRRRESTRMDVDVPEFIPRY